jgi:hypothetical protein
MLAVFVVSMVAGIILSVANGTFQPDAAGQVGLALGFSAFMVVGALIVAHWPSNAIGWMFSAIALLAVTALLAVEYATNAYVTRPGSLPGAILAAWYGSWAVVSDHRPGADLHSVAVPDRSAALAPLAAGSPGWPGRPRRP